MMLVGWMLASVDVAGNRAPSGVVDKTRAMIHGALSASIDPSARVEIESVGAGSQILAFVRVGPGATVGENCSLHEHAVLLGAVTLEDDVTVQSGAQLLGQVRVEQGATVGAGAVLGGAGDKTEPIVVRRLASVGANVTVLPGVVIGRGAVVEPGSVVLESVPAHAIVAGNPASIGAYVDGGQPATAREVVAASSLEAATMETTLPGVSLHRLTHARDLRGSLTAAEFEGLPFAPQRLFTVYDVPSESVRGAHAHRICAQFLICMSGAVSCLVDDSSARQEIRLDSPHVGLHIPPMIWGTQWKYSRDAVLLVLASHPYDPADYIRDYEEFLEALGA
jgi:UDP-2-acetamido-3-amino-2,3-dideoxy-glucuronate N-acetyltransferase